MKLDARIVLGVAVLAVVVAGTFALDLSMIHGYDGPIAIMTGMQDTYNEAFEPDSLVVRGINATSAYVTPTTPDLFDLTTPAGLRCEIQAGVNVLSSELIDTVYKSEIVNGWNNTQTVRVWKTKCQFSVTIATYGGGMSGAMSFTKFFIKIENNPDSVFTNTSESIAYVLNVYTREKVDAAGYINVVPTAGGYDFELTQIGETETPTWISESSYQDTLEKFAAVEISLEVLEAKPYFVVGGRGESFATFDIGADILLFGSWRQTKDVRGWDWPDFPDWLKALVDLLIAAGWYIIGFVATIVILWKVPDPRFKVLGVIVVWLIAGFNLGWFDSLLTQWGAG